MRRLKTSWLSVAAILSGAGCVTAPKERVDVLQIVRLEGARTGTGTLAALAQNPEPQIRARALRGLARLQDPAGLPAVIAGLSDADAGVRHEAAFAMKTLGLSWEPLDDKTRAEAEAAVRGAIAGDRGATEKAELMLALGAVAGEDGVRELAAAAASGDSVVGAAAAQALGNWIQRNKKKDWKGVLPETLGTALPVRRARAYLLFRAAGAANESLLAGGLSDGDAEVRALCAKGLSAKKSEAHAGALGRAAIRDPDWRVRVESVRALGAMAKADVRQKESAAHLFELSVSAAALLLDPEVYDAAELAGPLLELTTEYGFVGRGAQSVPASEATSVPLATMTLWAALESSAPESVVGAAARRILPGLSRARRTQSGTARSDAARIECAAAAAVDKAAGRIDEMRLCGGDAVTLLERERGIARALANPHFIGREIELMKRVQSTDRAARALALEALGKGEAGAIGPEAQRLIEEALSDGDGPVVATAADAVAAIADKDSVGPLLAALPRFEKPADAEIEQSIVGALGTLKAKEAEAPLRKLLENGNPAVRLSAKKALAEMGVVVPSVAAPVGASHLQLFFRPKASKLRVKTEKGVIVIALLRDDAPSTAGAIAALGTVKFYDGLLFHRVVPDFVAQGGDPRGDGWGGPGYTIPCELNPVAYERGAVGMALSGKDTGGSQFFIVHSAQPHLDGRYTIFGKVTEGMEVVDRLLPGDRIIELRPE